MAALAAPLSETADAPISYATAKSLKLAALAAAWHTANIRWGHDKDADKDLHEYRGHVAALRKVKVVPAGGLALLEKMMMAASWESANTRKGYKDDAAINHADYEACKANLVSASIAAADDEAGSAPEAAAAAAQRKARADPSTTVTTATTLVLEPDVVELVSSLIVSAAWFAANSRKGYDKDANRDFTELTRTFSCLYARRRPKWLGVNLGGWLLLERGPSYPLFEDTEAKHLSLKLPDEEFEVCTALNALEVSSKGSEAEAGAAAGSAVSSEALFSEHRDKHFTEADIVDIKNFGLNAVRVPFGYWCVIGATQGDPFIGPCLEYVDRVVGWCETHGLQVLLDLHGNPGGESSEKPCGRSKRDWTFNHWRREESLECLKTVATRYQHRECVAGIQVANETNRTLDPKKLVDHYCDCAKVIRECGMAAADVAVVMPFFFYDPPVGSPLRQRFLSRWRERQHELDHCVLDVHYYHFSNFNREEFRGSLLTQVGKNGLELDSLPLACVGEYSNACPPGCVLPHEQFLHAQLATYKEKATHGLFFWCWKDGAGVEWSLRDVSEGCKAEVLKAAATKGNMGESGRGEVGAGAGRRKTLGRRGSEGGEAEVHDDLGNSAKEGEEGSGKEGGSSAKGFRKWASFGT